jgi:hypothetical protein
MQQLPPKRPQTGVFNVSDFSFQNDKISYSDFTREITTVQNTLSRNSDDITTLSVATQVPVTPHTPVAGEIGYINNTTMSGFILAPNATTTVYNLPLLTPGTYAIDVTIRWAPIASVSSLQAGIWNVLDTFQFDTGYKSNYADGTSIRFTSVSRYLTVPSSGPSEQWYVTCKANTSDNTTIFVYAQITRIA